MYPVGTEKNLPFKILYVLLLVSVYSA